MDNKFQIEIKPEWDEITKIHSRCIDFLSARNLPADVIDSITMVVHELLENAQKYGNYEQSDTRIGLTLQINRSDITVEVTNRIFVGDSGHFRKLDKSIQWIRGYQNPFEAYAEKLKEVSGRSIDDRESGLGLVRIAYEGQSILDFYIMDNDCVNVSAVYQM